MKMTDDRPQSGDSTKPRVRAAYRSSSVSERAQEFRTIGAAQTRARVPPWAGCVRAVIPLGDVVEPTLACQAVEDGIEIAHRLALELVQERDEPGPQGRHGAGPTDRGQLSID